MDNDRRPRQTLAGYAGLQPQPSYPVVSASERYRQQPPTSAPASGSRASTSSQSYGYAYGEGSQFVGSSIQQPAYAGDYAAEQAPQRASQQYQPYGQSAMYNVPGAPAPATATSQYEPVQQYQQTRDSTMGVLGSDFGVAPPQYYGGVPSEGGPTSAPATAIATQNVPSQYPPMGYTTQPPAVGRESLAPAYSAATMTDPHQPTAPGAYAQASYGEQQQPQPHGSGSGSGNEYDDFYNNYQAELKKTFEYVRDGRLHEAAQQLFRLSDWLLHWAETLGECARSEHLERAAELTLGLVRDDEAHYQQRLKLWEEFNHCWLTLLQKQKELVAESAGTRQAPQPPQSLVDYEFLEKMGTQLVKNCDNMEKHGLVDYQMGVWEEEIIASEWAPDVLPNAN
jgi:hypothetical protein